MKAPVYGLRGEVKGDVTLGKAFSRAVRYDIIKRAVLAERAAMRQPYGPNRLAGQRTSADYIGTRGERNSMMNREMSRMKRIFAGGYLRFRARAIPGAVKGRKAHPPKVEKNWRQKINKKERLYALLSAVSGTADRKLVLSRGHVIEEVKHVPLVVDDSFSGIRKTAEVRKVLISLGLGKELERCAKTKIRAGKGKARGRRIVRRKGPLIVISEDKGISRAAGNIPGVDISEAKMLTVSMLAPGTAPGRLTIWTKSAAEAAESLAGQRKA